MNEYLKTAGIAVVATVVVLLGTWLVGGNQSNQNNNVPDVSVGAIGTRFPNGLGVGSSAMSLVQNFFQASSSAVFGGFVTHDAGHLDSYTNSTSTTVTTYTLALADFNQYDTILLTPNTGSLTLTFPASSTLSTWLPTAGDIQTTCFENSTTTASVELTIAGGTGFQVQVASSTGSVNGSLKIRPQKGGCFRFVRGKATPTTFDIHALFTTFQ